MSDSGMDETSYTIRGESRKYKGASNNSQLSLVMSKAVSGGALPLNPLEPIANISIMRLSDSLCHFHIPECWHDQ